MVDETQIALERRYSRAILALLRRMGEAGATANMLVMAIEEAEEGDVDDGRALVILGAMLFMKRIAEHEGRYYALGCTQKLLALAASELDRIERSIAEACRLRLGSEERSAALDAIRERSPRAVIRMLTGQRSDAAQQLRARGHRLEDEWATLRRRAFVESASEQWEREPAERQGRERSAA